MLAQAERSLGLDSWSVALYPAKVRYSTDEILCPKRNLMVEFKRWSLLRRAINDYDIIHFNFGMSICPCRMAAPPGEKYSGYIFRSCLAVYNVYASLFELADLPRLKNAGKKIVVTFQGDDARQADYCRRNYEISPADEVETGYYSDKTDKWKRERIDKFSQYADAIYALNPDLLNILPGNAEFLPYSHISLGKWNLSEKPDNPKQITIAHAPTDRGAKGSKYIIQAVERLQQEGNQFDFLLIENKSHSEVMEIYKRADLLIDQVLCGWYGGVAVEFMALGKPVIAYIRESDLKHIPDDMKKELPVINANKNTIYDVLRATLNMKSRDIADLGTQSRSFVEKWHNPETIARRLKKKYEKILAD